MKEMEPSNACFAELVIAFGDTAQGTGGTRVEPLASREPVATPTQDQRQAQEFYVYPRPGSIAGSSSNSFLASIPLIWRTTLGLIPCGGSFSGTEVRGSEPC